MFIKKYFSHIAFEDNLRLNTKQTPTRPKMATRLGNKEIKLVSTDTELRQMITELNESKPSLISVDAEGWDISRDGTLSLLALSWNDRLIYVIDVQVRFQRLTDADYIRSLN